MFRCVFVVADSLWEYNDEEEQRFHRYGILMKQNVDQMKEQRMTLVSQAMMTICYDDEEL